MNPKEKAKEIFETMCYWQMVDGGTRPIEAKECARVLIREQIKEVRDGFSYTDYRRKYWEEVESELNAL